ncbi:DUF4397 domain-containing protein [Chitinophaga pendula]|uniref:DUF4397 domain-containing protein n=1 Tax=Chitinophaga TaxID=79328 RepID=UPI0012FD22EE|nr:MULTISPECIES: DUF4397 domain-containing protein [Chitinophaga]UCJ07109.1 DUF4397 domain-containing protein [Chitinophaga pendula]
MKKYLFLLFSFVGLILLAGCNKGDYLDVNAGERPALNAYISFVNARPTATPLHFWTFTTRVTAAGVTPNSASPYLSTVFGNVQINFTEGAGTSYKVSRQFGNQAAFNANGGPNGPIPDYYHTVFAARKKTAFDQDTLILFYDNLEAPAAGKVKLRFVHLAPDVPAVSLRAIRDGKDSVLFSTVDYGSAGGAILSGEQLQAFSLGPFITLDARYSFQVRLVHTQELLPGLQRDLDRIQLQPGHIYTLFLYGLAGKTGEAGAALIEHAKS